MRELRALHGPVNMMEPLDIEVAGDEVSLTFAIGKRDGLTLAVDPESLDVRVTDTVTYPDRPKDSKPPYLDVGSTRVNLADGGCLLIWTDARASRVFAQRFNKHDRARGGIILISHPDADVLGPARAATADGKHVVVAFFATHLTGYELVAVSLDVADRGE